METVHIKDVKQGDTIWWDQHGDCTKYIVFAEAEDDGEKLTLYVMVMNSARTATIIWNYTNNPNYVLPVYRENPCEH